MKKSLNPCSKDSHRLSLLQGFPCVTTEIITDKFDVLRGRLLGNQVEVVMISQESTTKDVKLVGYDFRGHTWGTLVEGIAYGYSYCKGSAIFSLVYFKYHK